MRRKLPSRVERAVMDIQAHKIALAEAFERAVRGAASEVKTAVMCAPGCAHCCLYPVYMTVLEAVPLYTELRDRGRWTSSLRAKLAAHADSTLGLAPQVWILSLIPCPLLDKNRCMAHTARPLSCRATYSTSDPLRCHPHRMGGQPAILPKVGVLEELAAFENIAFKALGARPVGMPLSKALLGAEALCSGDLEIEALDAWTYKAFEASQ